MLDVGINVVGSVHVNRHARGKFIVKVTAKFRSAGVVTEITVYIVIFSDAYV